MAAILLVGSVIGLIQSASWTISKLWAFWKIINQSYRRHVLPADAQRRHGVKGRLYIRQVIIVVGFHRQTNVAMTHVLHRQGRVDFGEPQVGSSAFSESVEIKIVALFILVWDASLL